VAVLREGGSLFLAATGVLQTASAGRSEISIFFIPVYPYDVEPCTWTGRRPVWQCIDRVSAESVCACTNEENL
jgi:hypothetical protein